MPNCQNGVAEEDHDLIDFGKMIDINKQMNGEIERIE